ncbi:MAG: hypothetical protein ACK559_03330, partial [bacterium]
MIPEGRDSSRPAPALAPVPPGASYPHSPVGARFLAPGAGPRTPARFVPLPRRARSPHDPG